MTDRCEACWVDAGLITALALVARLTQEERYEQLVQARHSESDTEMVSPW